MNPFVNHREGIIETALNRKTYTDPDDPEAIRQLMKIFIDRVEVFEAGYGTIHYDLPARSLGLGDVPASETIYFEKRRGTVAPESCGLAQSMGMNRRIKKARRRWSGSPRRRGDEPGTNWASICVPESDPQARG